MPYWLEKLVIGIITKYLTAEVIKEFETAAAVFVVTKVREFAKSTDKTQIDDAFAEVLADALGVP